MPSQVTHLKSFRAYESEYLAAGLGHIGEVHIFDAKTFESQLVIKQRKLLAFEDMIIFRNYVKEEYQPSDD